MTELLEQIITAHGGRRRWDAVSNIHVDFSAIGTLWPLKGQDGILSAVNVDADPHSPSQHLSISPFAQDGWRGIFERDYVRIEDAAGHLQDERRDPRSSFDGHRMRTPWDHLHALYFSGYALWTYLTLPFILAQPGFSVEEVEPWTDNGESWRRLHVTFPDSIASHSTEQLLYIDRQGLIRRHDYTAEIIDRRGGAAQYLYDHKEFDGIVYPTARRVFPRQPDNEPAKEPVWIDMEFRSYVIT